MNNFLMDTEYEIRALHENTGNHLSLRRVWDKNICSSCLTNPGGEAVRIKEIVLFKGELPFSPDTEFYAEGYSMLSQYKGTLSKPRLISCVSDREHYRLPVTEGLFTVYNLIAFLQSEEHTLIAFSSCRHYSGEIRFNEKYFEIALDFEGLPVEAGESVNLEEVIFCSGDILQNLFPRLANRLAYHHPKQAFAEVPTGWCSWYSFGPDLTKDDVIRNLKAIKEKCPDIKYIQIDEGYAAFEGDWLLPGKSFPDGVDVLCREIKALGFEPAMWVGPFIAEADSNVFREHPDWFIKDEEGNPAPADRYTFGGWYHGPWYMLDGTHPGALDYLRHVFRTMHEDWGVNYFKMDGTMWGAMPFGKRHDPTVTRIDAYRMGMRAIREGAGEESFLMGCNAPMWPTLGTVNAMRLSDDISRSWHMIEKASEEMCWRSWQHNNLWTGDPDCLILENLEREEIGADGAVRRRTEGAVSADEYLFLAANVFASGGMVMSGDDFTALGNKSVNMIRRLIPPVGKAAIFDDLTFTVGRLRLADQLLVVVMNREDHARDITIDLHGQYSVSDYFTGEAINSNTEKFELKDYKAHLGRVFECVPL